MPINFPDSPTTGDTHTVGDKTWTYDGTAWTLVTGATADHGNLDGLADDDHTQYLLADGTRTATELTVSGDLTVDTNTLFVDSTNDFVGIGTETPANKLDVSGGLTVQGIALTQGLTVTNALGSPVEIQGGLNVDTSTLSVDSTNNRVGIGTVSPSTTLHVDGSILANDSVTIGDGGEYVAGSIYSDVNWGMIFRAKQASPAQADFRWANSADTQRAIIDSSGNFAIGTSAPRGVFDVQNQGSVYLIHNTTQQGTVNTYLGGHLFFSPWDTTDDVYLQARRGNDTGNTNMWFRTTNSSSGIINAMKIDASGRVGVGQTSPTYNFHAKGPEDTASAVEISSGNTAYRYHMRFLRNGGLLSNGIFSDTGATYFGNASDARLKTGVESIVTSDALMALNNLRPVEYRYLLDSEDTVRTGFIAQEVEEVLPEAVKRVGGGHLATQFVIDDNGEPQYLGVDANGDALIQEEPDLLLTWEPITTTLVAAVQELSSLVSSLTARIEALESSNP